MNFWLEFLGIITIPVAISALFIGGYIYSANLWQRRSQRLRARQVVASALPLGKGPHL